MMQNLGQIIKTIWPYMVLHAALAAIIFSAMFFALKKFRAAPTGSDFSPLKAGILVGVFVSLFYSTDLMIKNAQSQAMSQVIA